MGERVSRAGEDGSLLRDIATAVIGRGADSALWTVEVDGTWCRVVPGGFEWRQQGWKLHVSATLLSAPLVLSRVAEVVVPEWCPFKFSRDLGQLRSLLSSSIDRGSGGKFITVYPNDDDQFRRLAERLCEVTDGLPGPAILSDRPVKAGGVVHYRFGGFQPRRVFTNEGAFLRVLTAPDGEFVPDERNAWFSAPGWAEPPFAVEEAVPPARAESVILDGRFVVSKAIRHSYRGGVYRAVDQLSGAEVVVKQARPHVMAAFDGTDARDRLRNEAAMLERLGPLGLAPHPVSLFSQQDNVFLAQELVPGTTLTAWAAERAAELWRGHGPPVGEAVDLALQLVRMVSAVHADGLVLRDLTPNNVMVTPDGYLRLIDLEHVVPAGARAWRVFTAGYAAPEVVDSPSFAVAAPTADLYGLGATILHLASGRRPLYPASGESSRLSAYLHHLGRRLPAVRRLGPLILSLMHDGPEQRWTLSEAEEFLTGTPAGSWPETDMVLSGTVLDRLIEDGIEHIVRTMTPHAGTLWRPGEHGPATDPCNVQHGAAGVLGVLSRIGGPVADVARWIDQRLFAVPRLLPGLYFGRAGTAWSLFDAARQLGDDRLADRALELARRLPLSWPNPDVCHGMAGAGLAYLHLWRATGDPDLADRARSVADAVLAAGRQYEGRLLWPVPEEFDSYFAGAVHYGFAHGVAGVGAFLLYAGIALDRRDYLDAALRAGETLADAAVLEDGGAWWPAEARPGGRTRLVHWCSGSAGVGTFLIRLWSVTDDPRFRTLSEAAGTAVRRDQWYANTGACHGLPGHGEFLLDLADFTGDPRYRDWARDLATTMYVQHTIRDGRALIPDDSGTDVTVGYNSGLAGTLAFLHRLRHGGSRCWMPDETLVPHRVLAAVRQ